jgi:hypothetical protein
MATTSLESPFERVRSCDQSKVWESSLDFRGEKRSESNGHSSNAAFNATLTVPFATERGSLVWPRGQGESSPRRRDLGRRPKKEEFCQTCQLGSRWPPSPARSGGSQDLYIRLLRSDPLPPRPLLPYPQRENKDHSDKPKESSHRASPSQSGNFSVFGLIRRSYRFIPD